MKTYLIERSLEGKEDSTEYAMVNTEDHFTARFLQAVENGFCDEHRAENLTSLLHQDLSGRSILLPHPVAIYRIDGRLVESRQPGTSKSITFFVKLIFRFNENGNPVQVF